jgi:hypothetical protein
MKKITSICVLFLLFAVTASAQFEITPQFGYQINSKINFDRGEMKMPGSGLYGITGSYNLGNEMAFEFSWVHQDSELDVRHVNSVPNGGNWGDVSVNHYQFGSVQHFGYDDDLRPFIGISIGWSTFSPENNNQGLGDVDAVPYLSSTSTFTFGISGGVKYMFTDNIGIRVQSQLLLPTYYGGSYYGWYGYTSYSKVFAMLNFSGGLIFAFGD